MTNEAEKVDMAINDENILVKVKVSKSRYEQYKEAASRDRRSFSQWAEIALDEKLMRESKTPRP